jgi:integrase
MRRAVGLCLLVEWVELPTRDKQGRFERKAANVKMFRHTFAVRQLKAGQRPEDVARMMGHVDTTMIRKHYAPWVKDLDTAHIKRVVSSWSK